MTDALVQYGALGVTLAIALAAVRVLFAQVSAAAKLDRERADRLEDELRKVNADLLARVVPALVQATRVMSGLHERGERERE